MKTIAGTIPPSVLHAVGEETCEKYDREFWAAFDKKKSVFVGKTTRTNAAFQAYIAPLMNPNIIDAFNGNAPMPAPTPQEKAADKKELQAQDFVVGGIYRCANGDIVKMCGYGTKVFIGTSYETMYDELGVHRYTQRDLGRVTGSPHDGSEPRNIVSIYLLPVTSK